MKSTIKIPYSQGFEPLIGFNSSTGEIKASAFDIVDFQKLKWINDEFNNEDLTLFTTISTPESFSTFLENIDEADYKSLGPQAILEMISKHAVTISSNKFSLLVYRKVEFSQKLLENYSRLKLNPDAIKILKSDPSNFHRIYGSHFMVGSKQGSILKIAISIEIKNPSSRDQLMSEITSSWVSLNTKGNKGMKKFLDLMNRFDSELSIECKAEMFGAGKTRISQIEYDKIFDTIEDFNLSCSKSTTLNYIVANYNLLADYNANRVPDKSVIPYVNGRLFDTVGKIVYMNRIYSSLNAEDREKYHSIRSKFNSIKKEILLPDIDLDSIEEKLISTLAEWERAIKIISSPVKIAENRTFGKSENRLPLQQLTLNLSEKLQTYNNSPENKGFLTEKAAHSYSKSYVFNDTTNYSTVRRLNVETDYSTEDYSRTERGKLTGREKIVDLMAPLRVNPKIIGITNSHRKLEADQDEMIDYLLPAPPLSKMLHNYFGFYYRFQNASGDVLGVDEYFKRVALTSSYDRSLANRWELKPVEDNPELFLIYNVQYREYLSVEKQKDEQVAVLVKNNPKRWILRPQTDGLILLSYEPPNSLVDTQSYLSSAKLKFAYEGVAHAWKLG